MSAAAAAAPRAAVTAAAPSSAIERVEASRARLRLAMFPPAPPPRAAASGPGASWSEKLKSMPAVALLLDTLQGWWSHHPLRPVAQVAGDASDAAVRPMAQAHPIALVLSAAAAGAAIGWLKPWRWLFGSALFAGLVPRIASKMLLKMPIESWMGVAGAALRNNARAAPRRRTARRADAAAPEGAAR